MKIPFDITKRPQIESGEYKVILDCGVEAEILAWDKPGDYPIVCMARKDGAIPFRVNNNGKAYHLPEGANYSDLSLITPEPELSAFEKAIKDLVLVIDEGELQELGVFEEENLGAWAIKQATELLALAKAEVLKDRQQNIVANMIEDRIGGIQHDLIEFLSNTISASWVDVIKSADAYAERIRNMALKDLPRWKKCDPHTIYDTKCNFVVNGIGRYIILDGYMINVDRLEKLPGFKEDESHE